VALYIGQLDKKETITNTNQPALNITIEYCLFTQNGSVTSCVGLIYWSATLIILTQLVTMVRMRWVGHVTRMGEKRGAYRLLVERPEGRRPLARPRCRWEDNIKMDLQEVGWGHGLD
jgi:hypothetical protein